MIREVRREEIPACVRIIRNSHQTVADTFGFTVENAPRYVAFATDEKRLLWHMDSEHRLMFVDEESGVLRGYYSLLLKKDTECELGNLSVLPEYRHLGIGTALLKNILIRYSHVRQIELVTDSRPETIAFYESAGFRKLSDAGCTGFMKI